MNKMKLIIPIERIEKKIYLIRQEKVMLDRDLAELYGVETRVLKQAVRRSIKRFPKEFMFEMNKEELANWRSQFVTSKSDMKGLRYAPMVFTEQGVAMLSSVLKSEKAIQVNIQIMKTFINLRKMMATHGELKRKIEEMEQKYDKQFKVVFNVIKKLLEEPQKDMKKIGF